MNKSSSQLPILGPVGEYVSNTLSLGITEDQHLSWQDVFCFNHLKYKPLQNAFVKHPVSVSQGPL